MSLCTLMLALVMSRPALAHGYLIRAIPEDQAVLQRAPARVQYWFSEVLEPNFSNLTVRDASGAIIAFGGVDEASDSSLFARLPSNLPDGTYIVDMRVAFSSDGHVAVEREIFSVGQAASGVSSGVSDSPVPLEVVWRALVLCSTMLLLGTCTLYALVLIPGWGNPDFRAGLLPPRVMRRLNQIMLAGLVMAAVGNALALAQQAMVLFNTDFGQVMTQGLWDAVRTGTRFGEMWNTRMILLAIVAGLHIAGRYFRQSQPETVRAFWTANAWGMALVTATLSASSHASGSTLWPWTAIIADWLHALAVGVWVGGLAALTLTLPTALAPYEGETRRLALLAALRRFSRLATACLVIVIASGAYAALNWLTRPSDLTQTAYGGTLILKIALVAALLVVGLAHHLAANPERYARWLNPHPPPPSPSGRRGVKPLAVSEAARERGWGGGFSLLSTLRLETVLAVAVLCAAGLLSATPIPRPDIPSLNLPPLRQTQTVGDETVTLTITPGGPGVNSYDVQVTRGDQEVDGLTLRLRFADPAMDRRSPLLPVEGTENGLYVGTGSELGYAGEWWALLDLTGADGVTQRAFFDLNVQAAAAVNDERAPTLLNVLALVGALAAVVYAFYPQWSGFYRKLDFRPELVAVALGSLAFGIVVVVLAGVMGQQSDAQTQAILNPTPQVVNSVPPDAASLQRGRDLFVSNCPGWQQNTQAIAQLTLTMPQIRDEALYGYLGDGWLRLPPCNLTASQRWDVVNYLRTLEQPAAQPPGGGASTGY